MTFDITKAATLAKGVAPDKVKKILDWIIENPDEAKAAIASTKSTGATGKATKEAIVTDGSDSLVPRGAVGRTGEFLRNFAKVADSATDIANVVPVFGQIAAVMGDIGSAGIEAVGVCLQVADRAMHGRHDLAMSEAAGGAVSCALTAVPFIDQANTAGLVLGMTTGSETKSFNSRADDWMRNLVQHTMAQHKSTPAVEQTIAPLHTPHLPPASKVQHARTH